ncbi:MAG: hypothetical protein COZ31_03320 [Nitrospirae bacterium CG_4_10_14_3_um_filter_44_29]|nr:MAG: hypothetical protein COW90_00870 [Nitrospirae bacterium CG22_combo_CG10-13_8_21_14_all_44_11]PIV43950.1 MAG: hypothetical protein COS28_01390 [Nitrospirae bacterium CG02_land_8_20_14_3_00_44_33]PIV67052.1 MAG: hypothetical protein COS10_03135 [Nitrospirae bacterium CG01_land_8_20_14_3_00_44_22]PIW89684.1 MAG: hypothetical protein COZ93_03735 [Nitrospirae bacterium CG_4_8_14_3_um_filter_44_28]PIX89196.1 MAG: hypothetical protein COZ31_03320 [Nitrospirae bacterium CG_4_10_14_3_um_filter_4
MPAPFPIFPVTAPAAPPTNAPAAPPAAALPAAPPPGFVLIYSLARRSHSPISISACSLPTAFK